MTDDYKCRQAKAHAPSTRHTEAECTRNYAKPVLHLSVYSSDADCSNGGVSSRHKTVDLYADDVWEFDIDPAVADRAVKLVYRSYLGGIFHVEPVTSPEANAVGWMAGGTYVGTSDSRLREQMAKVAGKREVSFYGALSLHDRQESQALYNAMSN